MTRAQEISKKEVKQHLAQLFADPEGILTLLAGGLMISDFDDPEEALDEAIKAFNGNRAYFDRLLEKAPGRLLP